MDIVASMIAVTGAVERLFVMGLVGIGRPFPQIRNMSARLFFRLEVSGDYRRLPGFGPLDGKRTISTADDAVRGFHRPSIALALVNWPTLPYLAPPKRLINRLSLPYTNGQRPPRGAP
jgi:hypothetical protein